MVVVKAKPDLLAIGRSPPSSEELAVYVQKICTPLKYTEFNKNID